MSKRNAKANAIIQATKDTDGCTIYAGFPTCERCAGLIIQAGIIRVVTPAPPPEIAQRWAHSFITASGMYQEAGVEVVEL